MKKAFFTLIITILIAGTLLKSCKPATKEEDAAKENLNNAKENVVTAREDLADAKRAATKQEWIEFKKETDSAISENEARIAELKVKIKNAGKSIDASYENKVDTLEQKNADLKVKLATYKSDVNTDWQSFKEEFKYDMNELGQALKGLTVKNKK